MAKQMAVIWAKGNCVAGAVLAHHLAFLGLSFGLDTKSYSEEGQKRIDYPGTAAAAFAFLLSQRQ